MSRAPGDTGAASDTLGDLEQLTGPQLKIRFLPAQMFCISVPGEGWELGKDVGGAYERLVFPCLDFPPPPPTFVRGVFHPDDTSRAPHAKRQGSK